MKTGYSPGYVLILFYIFISFIPGCTNVKPAQTDDSILFADHNLFGNKPKIVDQDEIFQLSEDQQRKFLDYFNDPVNQNISPHWRVFNYLKKIVSEFNYQGDTYTAEQAIRLSGGNCLSLAIVTTALARLVNVDTGYQLIDDVPVYERSGQVIFKGMHVRSLLYHTDNQNEDDNGKYEFNRSILLVDYFPSGNERFIKDITKEEFVAMYYRNKAADAIAAGDYSMAYWLASASLKFEPDSGQAINMMAVIHRRVKDEVRAEQIYNYGLEHANDKLTLLKNYRILLLEQGRYEEAKQLSEKIAQYNDPSPFNMMNMANTAYNNGDYSSAITFYSKVVKLAPYLHEGYFGLAKSYYKLGYIDAAKRNMQEAVDHALKMSTKSLYQAKLMVLSQDKRSVH